MILVVAIILLLFSANYFGNLHIANAVSPSNYVDSVVTNSLDWYMQEPFLNLAYVKTIVKSWFVNSNFDFDNIDPVVVAVIDTGVNVDHEIFLGKYDENGMRVDSDALGDYDVLYRDQNGEIVGANTAVYDDTSYSDDNVYDDDPITSTSTSGYHGTHVAGIIAALIHELDLEDYIKIMPIKASYTKSKESKFSVRAINLAIDFAIENGADVVNMSLSSNDSAFGSSITDEMCKKTVFVAAAGNDSSHVARYPAAHSKVVGVMNYNKDVDNNIIKASRSNYGEYYDIFAPGSSIQSADGSTNDAYKLMSGTSMASPIVSFAAALTTLKCRAISNASGDSFDANDIVDALKSSSKSLDVRYGINSTFTFPVIDLASLSSGEDVMFASIKVLEGELNQVIGNISQIKLSASIYPFDNLDATYQWFVNDQLYSSSKEIVFTPSNQVTSSPIVIRVEASYVENGEDFTRTATIFVNVGYLVLDIPAIRELNINVQDENGVVDINNKYNAHEQLKLSFDNVSVECIDPNTSIIWYANGEIIGVGSELLYTFDEAGEYEIRAKINGIYTEPITINARCTVEEVFNITLICTATILPTVFAIILIAIIIKRLKKRYNKVARLSISNYQSINYKDSEECIDNALSLDENVDDDNIDKK